MTPRRCVMWLASVLAAGAPAAALAAQGVIVEPPQGGSSLGATGAAANGGQGAVNLNGTSLGVTGNGTSLGVGVLSDYGASNAGQGQGGPQVSLPTAVDSAFDEAIEKLPIVHKMRWAREGAF